MERGPQLGNATPLMCVRLGHERMRPGCGDTHHLLRHPFEGTPCQQRALSACSERPAPDGVGLQLPGDIVLITWSKASNDTESEMAHPLRRNGHRLCDGVRWQWTALGRSDVSHFHRKHCYGEREECIAPVARVLEF